MSIDQQVKTYINLHETIKQKSHLLKVLRKELNEVGITIREHFEDDEEKIKDATGGRLKLNKKKRIKQLTKKQIQKLIIERFGATSTTTAINEAIENGDGITEKKDLTVNELFGKTKPSS